VLKRLPQFTEARLEIAAQGYSGATPYLRLRDWPIVLVSLAILGGAIIRARMTR
jgi:apolipoprotein N-acyltransferase